MKNRKFITAIIFVFLLNAVAIGGWFFVFSLIKTETGLIKEINTKTLSNEKKIEQANSLKNIINDISLDREKINSLFLDKESLIKIIETLESLAKQTNSTIKIDNIVTAGEEGKLRLSFVLSGRYGDLFQYLVLLENIPYAITIDRVYFQKITSAGEWQADFEITLDSYLKS